MLKVLQTSVARRNDLGGSKDRRLLHYVVFCRPSSLKRYQPASFKRGHLFFRFKSNLRESWGVVIIIVFASAWMVVAAGRISQVC